MSGKARNIIMALGSVAHDQLCLRMGSPSGKSLLSIGPAKCYTGRMRHRELVPVMSQIR
jgi:hypothetical protein